MTFPVQTVGLAITNVLPFGSIAFPAGMAPADNRSKSDVCPQLPTDVFAVAAYLLKIGGIIPYFEPSPFADASKLRACHFVLTPKDRKAADAAAKTWRKKTRTTIPGEPPRIVSRHWGTLIKAWDQPVTPGHYLKREVSPGWWRAALLLTMISDMCCDRLLRDTRPKNPDATAGLFEGWIESFYIDADNPDGTSDAGGLGIDQTDEDAIETSGLPADDEPPATLCRFADSAVVCVLPKVRVAPVGATLRNVSRNLSLLPGRGEVRCSWHVAPGAARSEDEETLDILLIPEPRELWATDFEACQNHDGEGEEIGSKETRQWKRNWENFKVHQRWIDPTDPDVADEFIKGCVKLLKEAKKHSAKVNGVVLPEYALSFEIFEKLCSRLKREEEGLEFLISGSSDNCEEANGHAPEPGNHVLTRIWYGTEHETSSRSKHHRWRMDRNQVETYGLSSTLNPKIKFWWEDTPLGRRKVQFHRFRERSVLSVLICEELARSEPCHDVLRSVAPNLIFALLLDGPQIRQRWPAQYAANLADDPGSSVLTFTSFGLIDRSNKQGHHPENHSIALWKDDSGKVVEIEMPKGDGPRGVLLSLWPDDTEDRTITGKNSQVCSWRYASHFPIVLKE